MPFSLLLQYLAGCFICMDNVPLQQMLVKLFIHRLHIVYAAFDDPVSQCCSGELHSQLFPVRLLAVKRDAVHIFLVHHVGNRGRRCEAVLQQRTWCFSTNDNRSAVFLTFEQPRTSWTYWIRSTFAGMIRSSSRTTFFPMTSIGVLQYGQFLSSSGTVHGTSITGSPARISSLVDFGLLALRL